jgi:hypothetical protein
VLAAGLVAWLAWPALASLIGNQRGFAFDWPAFPDFLARRPPQLPQLAGKAFSYLSLGWLLAGAGLLPHVAAGLTVLVAVLLCALSLGIPGSALGWADVAVAIVTAIIITRWMPR